MAINPSLLEILVCPENKTKVAPADPGVIEELNQKISQGLLINRGGQVVKEKIDSGLVREDGRILYPVRQDIPVMLIEESFELK